MKPRRPIKPETKIRNLQRWNKELREDARSADEERSVARRERDRARAELKAAKAELAAMTTLIAKLRAHHPELFKGIMGVAQAFDGRTVIFPAQN